MRIDLNDKIILVTGASGGIGKAIVKSIGNSGGSIAAHFNANHDQIEEVIQDGRPKSRTFKADLSDEKEVIQLFEDVLSTFGKVDAIVNNAGIAISADLNMEDQDWVNAWQRTINVNLTATALLCKKAINHFLKEEKGGHIVNITSRAAFRGDTAEYMAYAASKGGLVSLTRSIARAYGKNNIKAFNIAPGFVNTSMAKSFIDEYGEDIALKDLALSRLTKPEDVAPMVTFLLSGLADHATGCTIDINAGSYVH